MNRIALSVIIYIPIDREGQKEREGEGERGAEKRFTFIHLGGKSDFRHL